MHHHRHRAPAERADGSRYGRRDAGRSAHRLWHQDEILARQMKQASRPASAVVANAPIITNHTPGSRQMGDQQSLSTISRQELEQQPQRKYDVAETGNRLAPIAAGLTLLISALGYMRSMLWGSPIDAAAAAEPSTELDDVTPGRLGQHQESLALIRLISNWRDRTARAIYRRPRRTRARSVWKTPSAPVASHTNYREAQPVLRRRRSDLMLPGASNDNTFFVPNSRDGASRGPTGASLGDTGSTSLAKSHVTSQPLPTDTAGETGADTSDNTEAETRVELAVKPPTVPPVLAAITVCRACPVP